MATTLPKYVQRKHGAYYYVRWNPSARKVVWHRLGRTYPDMLRAFAQLEEGAGNFMRDVLERYRAEVSDKQSTNTRRQRDWQINNLIFSFGNMHPEFITSQHVYRYLDARSKDAPVGANREVSLLCAVFTKAIHWGYVTTNPARGLERNKENPRRRYITDAEYTQILAASSGRLRNAIELAYLTGQRISDLLALHWSDVHADGIYFRQHKTGAELVVEMSGALEAVLARCKSGKIRGQTVLADSAGQRLNYWRVANPFRRLVRKLGLDVTFHDLRRKAGSDAEEDSRLLGHIDRRTLERVYRVKPMRAKPVR